MWIFEEFFFRTKCGFFKRVFKGLKVDNIFKKKLKDQKWFFEEFFKIPNLDFFKEFFKIPKNLKTFSKDYTWILKDFFKG